MVNESTLELIHAEVDGRLSAEQWADLRQRLAADEVARAMHRETAALRDLLAAIPPAEVPQGLAAAIQAALPPATSAKAPSERRFGGHAWAYFGAMAAAMGLVGIALHLGSDGNGLETLATVGTMVTRPGLATLEVDDPAIQGTITPRLAAGALVLDFDVQLQEDVAIVALDRGRALARVDRSPEGPRSQRFSLELPHVRMGSGPLVLQIMAGERLVDELQLSSPGG